MGIKVDVRKVTERSGNKNGKPWAMTILSCIVVNPDGEEAVGQVILPKDHPKVERGLHDGELAAVESQGGLDFRITKLTPFKVGSVSKTGTS